jgi:phospholipase/carboxylesterase
MSGASRESPQGLIHRFVRGLDESKPPLLLLHRTGGNEDDFIEVAGQIAPGAHRLAIRGAVLEDGKPRFFRRVGRGEFDMADLAVRIEQLAEFLEWAKAEYRIGSPVAFGFSNGANIIWTLMLSKPQALRGAILLRPMRAFQPQALPNLHGVPVLVLAGKHDTTVPISRGNEIPDLLQSAGAGVQLEWIEAAHDFCAEDAQKSAAWLARLNGKPVSSMRENNT